MIQTQLHKHDHRRTKKSIKIKTVVAIENENRGAKNLLGMADDTGCVNHCLCKEIEIDFDIFFSDFSFFCFCDFSLLSVLLFYESFYGSPKGSVRWLVGACNQRHGSVKTNINSYNGPTRQAHSK